MGRAPCLAGRGGGARTARLDSESWGDRAIGEVKLTEQDERKAKPRFEASLEHEGSVTASFFDLRSQREWRLKMHGMTWSGATGRAQYAASFPALLHALLARRADNDEYERKLSAQRAHSRSPSPSVSCARRSTGLRLPATLPASAGREIDHPSSGHLASTSFSRSTCRISFGSSNRSPSGGRCSRRFPTISSRSSKSTRPNAERRSGASERHVPLPYPLRPRHRKARPEACLDVRLRQVRMDP